MINLRRFIALLSCFVMLFTIVGGTVFAQTAPNRAKILFSPFYSEGVSCDANGNSGSNQSTGDVYVLGDSIIDWFANANNEKASQYGVESELLKRTLSENGWNPTISAKGGRQLKGSHYTTPDGLAQIEQDASAITSADSVVIALGTNRDDTWTENTKETFRNNVKAAVARVKELNKNKDKAKIFWVNLAYVGETLSTDNPGSYPYAQSFEDYNSVLNEEAANGGFEIIDWRSSVNTNNALIGTNYGDLDGYAHVHPSPDGVATYVDLIRSRLGTPPQTNNSSPVIGGATLSNNVPQQWRDLILGAAPKYPEVDPRMVASVLFVENAGWPEYKAEGWAESGAGARGPFQFIASTWFGRSGGWMDHTNEGNYSPSAMGTDGDGDGIRDPNNPRDAVEAAFKHHMGSAGKPIAIQGYTGTNFETDLNNTVFENENTNLLYYGRKYNGSGAKGGTKVIDFLGGGQNQEYVLAVFVALASDFAKEYDYPVNKIKDVEGATTGSSGASGSATGACPGGGASGFVNADGFAFPLEGATKSTARSFTSLPCTAGPNGCHHDNTPAFDLLITDQPTTLGKAVYAISDGEVTHVKGGYDGYSECYSINMRSARDSFIYTYLHIAVPKVTKGQIVTAGQQLAEVGPAHCGRGTVHLHLDRGCIKDGVPQSGGRDSCRDPGIVELINALYEGLPQ